MENKKQLDFERILALSYKAALYLAHKYAVDIALAEEKALDVWVNNKEKIQDMMSYEDSVDFASKIEAEKSVYFLFKDNTRHALGIRQKVIDGKKCWDSPFMQEVIYDTTNEDFGGLKELDAVTQKDVFYEHINDFNLTKTEKLVIDLTFTGYNYRNEIDVLVFQEVLQTESVAYVKTFFNRLCKKLSEESERIGLK